MPPPPPPPTSSTQKASPILYLSHSSNPDAKSHTPLYSATLPRSHHTHTFYSRGYDGLATPLPLSPSLTPSPTHHSPPLSSSPSSHRKHAKWHAPSIPHQQPTIPSSPSIKFLASTSSLNDRPHTHPLHTPHQHNHPCHTAPPLSDTEIPLGSIRQKTTLFASARPGHCPPPILASFALPAPSSAPQPGTMASLTLRAPLQPTPYLHFSNAPPARSHSPPPIPLPSVQIPSLPAVLPTLRDGLFHAPPSRLPGSTILSNPNSLTSATTMHHRSTPPPLEPRRDSAPLLLPARRPPRAAC